MKLYDLSPTVAPSLAVWPGDTPPSREVLMDMKRGDNLTLSTLRSTVHLGSHADAPSHTAAEAPSIESRSLESYLGPCQVIRVAARRGTRILPDEIPESILAPRVLNTRTPPFTRHRAERGYLPAVHTVGVGASTITIRRAA